MISKNNHYLRSRVFIIHHSLGDMKAKDEIQNHSGKVCYERQEAFDVTDGRNALHNRKPFAVYGYHGMTVSATIWSMRKRETNIRINLLRRSEIRPPGMTAKISSPRLNSAISDGLMMVLGKRGNPVASSTYWLSINNTMPWLVTSGCEGLWYASFPSDPLVFNFWKASCGILSSEFGLQYGWANT